jgi:catechol 2,3-dioxygenase-like lactoylglutathione lyase family enzyme
VIRDVHHVAFVLPELESAIELFRGVFGAVQTYRELLPESFGIEVAVLRAGDAVIELLRPYQAGTQFWDFLRQTGGGLHHVSFNAPGLDRHAETLRRAGIEVLPPGPYRSPTGWRVLNINNATTHRTVSQLSED